MSEAKSIKGLRKKHHHAIQSNNIEEMINHRRYLEDIIVEKPKSDCYKCEVCDRRQQQYIHIVNSLKRKISEITAKINLFADKHH